MLLVLPSINCDQFVLFSVLDGLLLVLRGRRGFPVGCLDFLISETFEFFIAVHMIKFLRSVLFSAV